MDSNSKEIIKRDKSVISPSLTRDLEVVYKKADGCNIWDTDGKKYLDFTASVAVNNAGHNNPEVKKAIVDQLENGIHCCFSDFYAELPVTFAETLLSLVPKSFEKVFLSNSGTESTEAAYKLARWHTNRTWVIAFDGAFHGRTMGSLSLTKSKSIHRERFDPFLPVVHVPYPYSYKLKMEPEECSNYCLGLLEDKIRAMYVDLAGIFIEPILGEGGYVVPPKSFLLGVRKLCDEFGILLCTDEVQSGCFRSGKFLAAENFNITADITWMSKALAGGLPIGATIASSKIMDWPAGTHANTFGGNLLSSAAGIACLTIMKKAKLGENAKKIGDHILKRASEFDQSIVVEVRGIGLMIGLEINDSETRDLIIENCAKSGLLLLPAGESVIRICPPLTLTKEEANSGLDIIEATIKKI